MVHKLKISIQKCNSTFRWRIAVYRNTHLWKTVPVMGEREALVQADMLVRKYREEGHSVHYSAKVRRVPFFGRVSNDFKKEK